MYQGLPQFPITFCDINTLWKSKFRLSTWCEFEKRGFCGNLWISRLILSYLQGFVQKPVHITQGFREFSTYSQGGATVLYNHVENVEKMWILGKTKLTGCYIADFYQHNAPLLSGKLLRLLNLNFLKKLLSTLEFDGGSVNFR